MPGSIRRAPSGLESFCWEPFRCARCNCVVDDRCEVYMSNDNAYCGEHCRDIHSTEAFGLSMARPASGGGGMRRTTSNTTVSSTSSLSSASSQSVSSMDDYKLVRMEPISEQPFLTASRRTSVVDSFLGTVFKGLAHVGSDAMHNF